VDAQHDFDRVYREAAPGLYRALYAFAGGRRDIAEEALAEAFARAVERRRTIRSPVPWIYRTAFRVARRELELEGRRGTATEVASEPPMPVDLEELVRGLRALSPNQRAAVVLRFEADLDVGEIAERMGISRATVRVHIHRGRRKLRALLGADEASEEVTDA
jgi:RNA polymerase sigma-70 factor (ECF subfamily)